MTFPSPVHVLCLYRMTAENEAAFRALLDVHWSTLDRAGLVSATPAHFQRGTNNSGAVVWVENFEWKDASSPGLAHQMPEVMKVWEPMGALTESMEFIDLEPAAAASH
jgi:hypothetical protein